MRVALPAGIQRILITSPCYRMSFRFVCGFGNAMASGFSLNRITASASPGLHTYVRLPSIGILNPIGLLDLDHLSHNIAAGVPVVHLSDGGNATCGGGVVACSSRKETV